jgi:hypothetical protein
MLFPISGSRQQLRDSLVECKKPHLSTHCGSQQPSVGNLTMSQNSAGADFHDIGESEVHRSQLMLWMRGIAQKEFGDFSHGNRPSREYLLAHDADEGCLGESGGRPTSLRMLPKPGAHLRVMFVCRPTQRDESVRIEKLRHAASSSNCCTLRAVNGAASAGRSTTQTPSTCFMRSFSVPPLRISSETASPSFRALARA